MQRVCPSCLSSNPPAARFCGQCGAKLPLDSDDRVVVKGEEWHPDVRREAERDGWHGQAERGHVQRGDAPEGSWPPQGLPIGFQPCQENEQFQYSWEAVGRSSLFGCEYLGVAVINRGEPAHQIRLRCSGFDADENLIFEVERGIHRLDRGQTVCVEIPRHEVPSVPQRLDVRVVAWTPDSAAAEPQERSSQCRPWWSSEA